MRAGQTSFWFNSWSHEWLITVYILHLQLLYGNYLWRSPDPRHLGFSPIDSVEFKINGYYFDWSGWICLNNLYLSWRSRQYYPCYHISSESSLENLHLRRKRTFASFGISTLDFVKLVTSGAVYLVPGAPSAIRVDPTCWRYSSMRVVWRSVFKATSFWRDSRESTWAKDYQSKRWRLA